MLTCMCLYGLSLIQMQNNRFEKIVTKQARLGLKK